MKIEIKIINKSVEIYLRNRKPIKYIDSSSYIGGDKYKIIKIEMLKDEFLNKYNLSKYDNTFETLTYSFYNYNIINESMNILDYNEDGNLLLEGRHVNETEDIFKDFSNLKTIIYDEYEEPEMKKLGYIIDNGEWIYDIDFLKKQMKKIPITMLTTSVNRFLNIFYNGNKLTFSLPYVISLSDWIKSEDQSIKYYSINDNSDYVEVIIDKNNIDELTNLYLEEKRNFEDKYKQQISDINNCSTIEELDNYSKIINN